MNRNCRRKTEKVYVKVNSDFDATGYMQPRQITWGDLKKLSKNSIESDIVSDVTGGPSSSNHHHSAQSKSDDKK